jgi:hypothetical protein
MVHGFRFDCTCTIDDISDKRSAWAEAHGPLCDTQDAASLLRTARDMPSFERPGGHDDARACRSPKRGECLCRSDWSLVPLGSSYVTSPTHTHPHPHTHTPRTLCLLRMAQVRLPIFMPVGTQGTMKGLTTKQLAATGCKCDPN